jgi:glucose-1-phosphate cytidylyltransferase
MKVVLFCGGLGTRIREEGGDTPKPLITIGYRPIVWHLMMYYAHFGHKDFILCLGYKADAIKKYFLEYNEALSNDFILNGSGQSIELMKRDIQNWRITFVDTGLNSNIGQRLKSVEKLLAGEEAFLANYADGLTDAPLDKMLDHFYTYGKIASILCVRPNQSLHVVSLGKDNVVDKVTPMNDGGFLVNGGFFIFRHEIFDYLKEGEELVIKPFNRLIKEEQLIAYRHDGFWACMDTFKERQYLEQLYAGGQAPWMVWQTRQCGRNSADDISKI